MHFKKWKLPNFIIQNSNLGTPKQCSLYFLRKDNTACFCVKMIYPTWPNYTCDLFPVWPDEAVQEEQSFVLFGNFGYTYQNTCV